jgi:hypothetical protein
MKSFQCSEFALTSIIIVVWQAASVLAQTDKAKADTKVAVEQIGPVEPIWEAEHLLGGHNRIFLIEDEWEHERCSRVLPKLPTVDLRSESLLVIMSWKSMPRTFTAAEVDQGTLAIKIAEAEPPKVSNGSYEQPDFLVFKLPLWNGPVRVVINDKPSFTIQRGEQSERISTEIWEEILRVHSGGRPTTDQMVRHYKRMWRKMPDSEIRKRVLTEKKLADYVEPRAVYEILFRDLVDLRAKSITPRIFELIDTMGRHDEAFGPACTAIVGIGGSDLLGRCKDAFKSWNPRSHHAAIIILKTLSIPESRTFAYEHLADVNESVGRGSLDLLYRLGMTKGDVPHLVAALEKVEKYYVSWAKGEVKDQYFAGDVAPSIIYALGDLGPEAKEALPAIHRFEKYPFYRDDAEKAIKKIKGDAAK